MVASLMGESRYPQSNFSGPSARRTPANIASRTERANDAGDHPITMTSMAEASTAETLTDTYCVGYDEEHDASVIRKDNNCNGDGYKHQHTFRASAKPKDGLMPYSIGRADGDASGSWTRHLLNQKDSAAWAQWKHDLVFYASENEADGLEPFTAVQRGAPVRLRVWKGRNPQGEKSTDRKKEVFYAAPVSAGEEGEGGDVDNKPLYKQWWFWAVVEVIVVLAIAGVVVARNRGGRGQAYGAYGIEGVDEEEKEEGDGDISGQQQ